MLVGNSANNLEIGAGAGARPTPLKVVKCEIFVNFFTLINPIWVGNMRIGIFIYLF